jgi:hypothetical protein
MLIAGPGQILEQNFEDSRAGLALEIAQSAFSGPLTGYGIGARGGGLVFEINQAGLDCVVN